MPEEVAERFNEYARTRAAGYQTDDEDPPAVEDEEDDPPLPRRGRPYRDDDYEPQWEERVVTDRNGERRVVRRQLR